ncbi:MAG: ArnT family glycosyltransferase [Bdellovibrionota bacterium]|jgi:4-amino-4-deoxy-L-arabinose transferase-like glycosyltransferase
MQKLTTKILFLTLILLLSAFFFFYNLGEAKLFFGDESIHVSVIKEMLLTGDLLHPTFRSHTYLSKPPLKMWGTLALVKTFEPSLFWLRFPDALFSTLSLVFIFLIALKLFKSPLIGFLSTLFLIGSETFLLRHCARMAVQDSSIFLSTTISLYLFLILYERKKVSPKFAAELPILIGVITSAALLTKYVAGLYAIMSWCFFLLISTPLKKLIRNWYKEFIVIAVFSIVPFSIWICYVLTHYYSDFYNTFVVEIYQRLLGSGLHNASKKAVYFNELFLKGSLLPLSLIWPLSVYWIFKVIKREGAWIFLFAWGICPVILFSLLSSKLIWYIIPSYPAICLAAAAFLSEIATFVFKNRTPKKVLNYLWKAILLTYLAVVTFQVSKKIIANADKVLTKKERYVAQILSAEIKTHLEKNDPQTRVGKVTFLTPNGVSILKKTPLTDYNRFFLLDLLPYTAFIDDSNDISKTLLADTDFIIFPACRLKEVRSKIELQVCATFDNTIFKGGRKKFPTNHYVVACLKNCLGLTLFKECSAIPHKIQDQDCAKIQKQLRETASKITPAEYAKRPSIYAPLRD